MRILSLLVKGFLSFIWYLSVLTYPLVKAVLSFLTFCFIVHALFTGSESSYYYSIGAFLLLTILNVWVRSLRPKNFSR